MISIDFETRSAVDLIINPKRNDLAGLYNYASDPSTDVICMAYSVDGMAPELWVPGMPVPDAFYDSEDRWEHTTHYAWNATFERLIWDFIMVPQYGFPPKPLESWRCTAYMSRCSNMPAALGNAARCLNVAQQKQDRGRELIKLLSVPMADGTFCQDHGLLWEMYDYCLQDVRAEMAVATQLRPLTPEEWADWHANERVNDRGVMIDRAICDNAQVYAEEELADLVARIEELTEGAVVKARGEKLKAWVVERLTPEQEKLLVKYRGGERKLSLDKYNRGRLLALDDVDPVVREVVECSDFAQKSSVGKFKAMARIADPEDNRVRGAFLCNGASASGRYSSKGLQVHNFPRDCMDNPEEVKADFIDQIIHEDMVDYYGKPIMTILSHMLRPALVPAPGNKLLAADWSAIEGRVAPWLCLDDGDAMAKLQLYADDAPVYEIAAAQTFRVPVDKVTKDQRQVGKVEELAFQFGGGAMAFLGMARNYGLRASRDEAERYKNAWRRNNQWAERIWAGIEDACFKAVRDPNTIYEVGRLKYFAVEDILAGGTTLFCQLPCGRLLTYPDTRIQYREAPWGDLVPALTVLRAAFVPKADEKEWPRTAIYGGLLFENAVQGTAASLLRSAVRDADDYELPVVLHVHDELVAEVPEADVEEASTALADLMNTPPVWAIDLPLKAEVVVMDRYGK